MRYDSKSILSVLFILFLLGLSSLQVVLAAPVGPTVISPLGSSRYGTPGAANISAIAGNVTEINFNVSYTTNTWQGYYGNITGTIVLGNSNNQTLYDWAVANPRGQIYATRTPTVPAWTTVRCANVTDVNTEDTALGVNQSFDQDSVNRTFLNSTGSTSFAPFYVGNININGTAQTCYSAYLNDQTGAPTSSFAEVLLSDNATASMIYTGILTLPSTGFDGRSHQFQMLVGENGHNGDSSSTPYYFYLELS